tara:strand:- start:3899 stop:4834 length:936 start_codon:yes stop_codon:yes gene_type:complete
MLKFLYCLDSNYNQQFLTSLNSVLENIDETIDCYVIHKNPESLKTLIEELNFKHKNLNSLSFFKFKETIKKFPNLGNNHVSEATYYRFFIDNYFDESIDNIIYLDCDVICLNNPRKILNELNNKVSTSNNVIAASTEYIKSKDTREVFDRLEMKSNSYFNAGIMIVDVKKWRKQNIQKLLVNLMYEIYENIDFWDQDIMNCFFDGAYLELSEYLNFKDTQGDKVNDDQSRSIIFLHYAGSNKPWTIPGSFSNYANYFHESYSKIFKQKYLLTNNYKKKALFDLIQTFLTLKFLKLNYPVDFLKLSLKSLRS